MSRTELSVVIPAFDAERTIGRTIAAVCDAVERTDAFATEIVLVDDGSADDTATIGRRAAEGRVPLRVVTQPNRGRFEARRAGIDDARGEWILLLDSRVTLHPDALGFVARRLEHGERIWNGHVHVLTDANAFGAFWKAVAHIAWKEYFAAPMTTSFGADRFDHYPKGTTCFLAPRALLCSALDQFASHYGRDTRSANDDTTLIRALAEQERINISPCFACDYEARSTLKAFVLHGVHRGTVFVDGHLRPESRFFPAAVSVFPLSVVAGLTLLRRPGIVAVGAFAGGVATAAAAASSGCTAREARDAGVLAPLYAVAHTIGMWRGLGLLIAARRHRS
jgi:hypothetical protein